MGWLKTKLRNLLGEKSMSYKGTKIWLMPDSPTATMEAVAYDGDGAYLLILEKVYWKKWS